MARFKLKFSDGLIIFLVLINVLAVLAPILQHHGFIFPAKVIYFIYSFFCHQIHWRSLHVYDHQCAWCARDMAIWGAFLITAVWVRMFQLKGLKWYQILPFMIPIGLDGGIQTIATAFGSATGDTLYVSTNLLRTITGSIFGIGLGMTVMPMLTSIEFARVSDKIFIPRLNLKFHQLAVVPITFLLVFTIYLGFVQVWNATSTSYKPSNALDSAVKMPEDDDAWLVRRQNGLCPVTLYTDGRQSTDALALKCFF